MKRENAYFVLMAMAILIGCINFCSANQHIATNRINVANADQLKRALSVAKPGDSIVIQDGEYAGKFIIPADRNGTEAKPIFLTGSKKAILDAGTTETGYVLHLKASHWVIKGFTLKNGLKGLMADEASYNKIENLSITQIGEEGIHLRKFSKHNTVLACDVTHTGIKNPAYGEGIYIGSAYSNWEKYTNGAPDQCDSNRVLNNKLGPFIGAECIDIKEGTTGGIISNNIFDAQGITGENSSDSWMDIKGNHYLISNNTGYNEQPSVLKDGFQVNCVYTGWGSYNQFKGNVCNVNADGYGINIRLKSSKGEAIGNEVYSDNVVKGATKGITNIQLINIDKK